MSLEEIWAGSWRNVEQWVAALYVTEEEGEEDESPAWPTRVEIVAGNRFALGQNPGTDVDISELEQDDGVRQVREAAERVIQEQAGDRTQVTLTFKGFLTQGGEEQPIAGRRGSMTATFTRKMPPAPVAAPAQGRSPIPIPFSPRSAGEPLAGFPRGGGEGPELFSSSRRHTPPSGNSGEGMEPNTILQLLWAMYLEEKRHREFVLGENTNLTTRLVALFEAQAINAQNIAADERKATRQAQAAELKVEQARLQAAAEAVANEAKADIAAKKSEVEYRIRMAELKEQHQRDVAALREEFEETRQELETDVEEEDTRRKRRRKPKGDPFTQKIEALVQAAGDKIVERIAGGPVSPADPSAKSGPLPGVPPADPPVRPMGSRPAKPSESARESDAAIMAKINAARPEELALVLLSLDPEKRRAALQALARFNHDAAIEIADEMGDALEGEDEEEPDVDDEEEEGDDEDEEDDA